jgi:Caspase domain
MYATTRRDVNRLTTWGADVEASIFARRRPAILLFCALIFIGGPLVRASRADAPHIHILFVADDADATIGQGVGVTVGRIQSTFARLVPEDRYTLRVLRSSRTAYTARLIIDVILSEHVREYDTFVLLYAGHGARENGHHFLQLPGNGMLWSKTLQDAVQSKPCDLKIVITDSCNVDPRNVQASGQGGSGGNWIVERDGIAPVMEELFIRHSGLLHMNTANIGQFGFTNRFTGSWFFEEFLEYLSTNPTGRPTWTHMDHKMDRLMNRKFTREFGTYVTQQPYVVQTSLYPITWSYPTPWPNRQMRFGVVATEQPGASGVVVNQVYAQTAGSRIAIFNKDQGFPRVMGNDTRVREAFSDNQRARLDSLRAGDVILRIDREPVSDRATFEELVSGSSRSMIFEFKRGAEYHEAAAILAW